ncbi:hypothetical protein ACFX13_047629 [Malus domestica]
MIDGRVRKNLCLLLEFELPKLKVLSWMYSGIDDEALAMIGKRCPSLQILNLAGSGEELQKAEVDKFTATLYEDNPSEQKAAMLASVKHCIT